MTVDTIIRKQHRWADAVSNIYMNAARFMYTAHEIDRAVQDHVWNNSEFKKLPRYAQSFVEGVRGYCDREHWKLIEYSYAIDGERLLLSDPKYRAIPSQEISEKWSHTGCHVYKSDVTKRFTALTKAE